MHQRNQTVHRAIAMDIAASCTAQGGSRTANKAGDMRCALPADSHLNKKKGL